MAPSLHAQTTLDMKPDLHANPGVPVLVPDATAAFDDQQRILEGRREEISKSKIAAESNCFLPPLVGVHSATVGVETLEAQVKGSSDYEKTCGALAANKFDEAEKHLWKSVDRYPKYPALWVLLGQLLEKRQQLPQARESCSRAIAANAAYVPGYLCLADIALRGHDWNEVLKQSDRALGLDPASNAISYVFNAGANLSLHHITEAEKSALRALQFTEGVDPRQLHYMLAEIYEAKGDIVNEMSQLREFLKFAGDSKEGNIVRQYLATLSDSPAAASTSEPAAK